MQEYKAIIALPALSVVLPCRSTKPSLQLRMSRPVTLAPWHDILLRNPGSSCAPLTLTLALFLPLPLAQAPTLTLTLTLALDLAVRP